MTPRLDAIGIVSADVPRSLTFYRLLGIEIADGDGPHLETTLPSGLRLMFDSLEMVKKIDPEWQPPVGQRTALAFHCETPSGVDATYRLITEAGFAGKSEPWNAFWGQRYAQVIDPDGNVVDLFAPL